MEKHGKLIQTHTNTHTHSKHYTSKRHHTNTNSNNKKEIVFKKCVFVNWSQLKARHCSFWSSMLFSRQKLSNW